MKHDYHKTPFRISFAGGLSDIKEYINMALVRWSAHDQQVHVCDREQKI